MATPNSESVGKEKQEVGVVLVVGKLIGSRKAGQMFENLVKMPAPDPYSSPSTLSIISKTRLGAPEDDIRVICRLTGYGRSYKSTDQETGEQRQVKTADNKLFAE